MDDLFAAYRVYMAATKNRPYNGDRIQALGMTFARFRPRYEQQVYDILPLGDDEEPTYTTFKVRVGALASSDALSL